MLTFHLDSYSSIPMYEQIYQYIRQEIRNGSLPCNEKLPSTRKLASHLQVSRNTIDMAYSQLLSEGYIESKPKCGFFVCQISELSCLTNNQVTIQKHDFIKNRSYQYDFSPFAIDITNFPFSTWRKLSRECMHFDNNELFLLGEKQGDITFRNAIRKYLHESRGVNCSLDQIIVGAGADYLLQLLSQLLPKKYTIAMENPTYKQAYMIFHGLSRNITPISLTTNGINIDELEQSDANICYVTPAHQYPVGIIMPYAQRTRLLHWAYESTDRYIIEDDHDSEFRYRGKPIPSLASMDSNDKVIYLGTFSRAIAPAIRIGYMILPKPLLEHYQKNFSYYSSTVSRVDQAILTSFIEGGYFERHLNRMRKIYKNKHDTLINALKVFGKEITILNDNAGLHVLVQYHGKYMEQELLDIAKKHGIRLYSLSEHYITKPPTSDVSNLLFGFGNLSEDRIKLGIKTLYDVLHS